MRTFKKIFIFAITLGVIAVSLNMLLGASETSGVISFVEKTNLGGLQAYKFNYFNYAKNLETAFTNIPKLLVSLPERQWKDITSTIVEEQFWQDLVNNLAYILDIIIAVANVFLFPIRLAAYVMQVVLAIIGLPMINYETNKLAWLIDTMKFLTTLQISYV